MVSAFHKRFEATEVLKQNPNTPIYAHYKLTIPGTRKGSIVDELRLVNITNESLFPGLDEAADAVTEAYRGDMPQK